MLCSVASVRCCSVDPVCCLMCELTNTHSRTHPYRIAQVYNETIRDLLVIPELSTPLDMREDPEKGCVAVMCCVRVLCIVCGVLCAVCCVLLALFHACVKCLRVRLSSFFP